MNLLNNLIDETKANGGKELTGAEVFKLHDTFGFPMDLTKEIALEAGIEVDEEGFAAELQKQKNRSREERLKKNISGWSADLFGELTVEPTVYTGYEKLADEATVLALAEDENLTDGVSTDDGAKEGVLVILDKTPFYAEMGGQVADHGTISTDNATLRVLDVKKTPKGYFVHTCVLESGLIQVGDKVNAQVDKAYHMDICRNHTATHLMQAALREVLGDHVHQAGSYQDAGVTRFDFTHFSAVTPEELKQVEDIVNEKIMEGMDVDIRNMPIAEAKELGAMALFGEKYGEVVRVVNVQGWSTEFCGGSHVSNTAQIGCFKIVSESSVAAGTRRVEAVTGRNAVKLMQENEETLKNAVAAVKASGVKELVARAEGLVAENKALAKELADLKAAAAAAKANSLFDNAVDLGGVRVLTEKVSGGADALRSMCDTIRDKAPDAVAVLVSVDGEKMSLAVSVSKEAQAHGLKAGLLVKDIAAIAGGKGGGKPDFAMAGLKDASKIDEALAAAADIVKANMK